MAAMAAREACSRSSFGTQPVSDGPGVWWACWATRHCRVVVTGDGLRLVRRRRATAAGSIAAGREEAGMPRRPLCAETRMRGQLESVYYIRYWHRRWCAVEWGLAGMELALVPADTSRIQLQARKSGSGGAVRPDY